MPLLAHNNQTIVQSDATLCHLAEYKGAFGGESSSRMDLVREWLFWEANQIGFSLPPLRFARRFVPEDYPLPVIEWIGKR